MNPALLHPARHGVPNPEAAFGPIRKGATPHASWQVKLRPGRTVRGGIIAALLLGPGFGLRTIAHADRSPEERGAAITETIRERTRGFGSLSARLRMTLENRRGQTSDRWMYFRILEREDGGTYTLCRVEDPPDVRGTALLSHTHPEAEDHQWLYMPAAQRTRRIAGGGRSGSFMGSEFAYEDLTGSSTEGHSAHWLKDELFAERLCHVVAYTPTTPGASGYSRKVVWVDQEDSRFWQVEYYNPRGEKLKTLTLSDYRRYNDNFWQAHRMEMVNHLTGNRTRLKWSDVEIGVEFNPADFERDRLPAWR